ncbi:MAG: general secretion pathway protein GspB [Planctomycetota bacterium]|nr:general secretion pathway protein GspB [Planctomycetota bacterium]
MNEKIKPSGDVCKPSRWAGLMLWLASRPRGRWATARGRWCQTVLTAALILTGVSAWALALVQPWTGRGGEHGIVSVAGGMDTEKIRSASAGVEKLFPTQAQAARPLARNPFMPREARASADPETRRPENLRPEAATPAAPAAATPARNILETIKGLRLEVTLATPTGERWAVINGENLREGDTIAGLEITEIQEGKVKLQHGGTTCVLRMD